MPSQRRDPAQVDPAIGQHVQEGGVLASRASDADAEVSLLFGEMKHVGAVHEH